MNLNEPKFWKDKNFIYIFIFFLSLINFLLNFSKKIFPKHKFKIKTVCIGNIYIGGTGKTSWQLK